MTAAIAFPRQDLVDDGARVRRPRREAVGWIKIGCVLGVPALIAALWAREHGLPVRTRPDGEIVGDRQSLIVWADEHPALMRPDDDPIPRLPGSQHRPFQRIGRLDLFPLPVLTDEKKIVELVHQLGPGVPGRARWGHALAAAPRLTLHEKQFGLAFVEKHSNHHAKPIERLTVEWLGGAWTCWDRTIQRQIRALTPSGAMYVEERFKKPSADEVRRGDRKQLANAYWPVLDEKVMRALGLEEVLKRLGARTDWQVNAGEPWKRRAKRAPYAIQGFGEESTADDTPPDAAAGAPDQTPQGEASPPDAPPARAAPPVAAPTGERPPNAPPETVNERVLRRELAAVGALAKYANEDRTLKLERKREDNGKTLAQTIFTIRWYENNYKRVTRWEDLEPWERLLIMVRDEKRTPSNEEIVKGFLGLTTHMLPLRPLLDHAAEFVAEADKAHLELGDLLDLLYAAAPEVPKDAGKGKIRKHVLAAIASAGRSRPTDARARFHDAACVPPSPTLPAGRCRCTIDDATVGRYGREPPDP